MSELELLAEELGQALLLRGAWVGLAESCTGGWVAQTLTAIPGSSNWFERGFVTYSNAAKAEMLGVPQQTLAQYGAVSEQTARAMANGVLAKAPVDWAVAITGIAGPGGGSPEKPVGTVCFAWAQRAGECSVATCCFAGDRAGVREQSVRHALQGLLQRLAASALLV